MARVFVELSEDLLRAFELRVGKGRIAPTIRGLMEDFLGRSQAISGFESTEDSQRDGTKDSVETSSEAVSIGTADPIDEFSVPYSPKPSTNPKAIAMKEALRRAEASLGVTSVKNNEKLVKVSKNLTAWENNRELERIQELEKGVLSEPGIQIESLKYELVDE